MPLPPVLLLAEGTDGLMVVLGLVGGGGVGLGLAESGTVDTEMKEREKDRQRERVRERRGRGKHKVNFSTCHNESKQEVSLEGWL